MSKVLITLGATGGHIFPAVAISEAINKVDDKIEVAFVNAYKTNIKMSAIKESEKIYQINSLGFMGKTVFEKIKALFFLIISIMESVKIIINFKPNIIISTGGFVSLPVCFSGFMMNKKIYIVEGNSVPGIANKIVSKFSKKIFINFDETKKYFPEKKCYKTGFPIRNFEIKKSKKDIDILILGGSQGSKIINSISCEALNLLLKEKKDIYKTSNITLNIVHQTGQGDMERIKQYYSNLKCDFGFFDFQVFDFIKNLDEFYSKSKILITRAGASTICESQNLNLPCIFIPIKNSTSNHQYLNALELKNNKMGLLHEENDKTEELTSKIYSLLNDDKLLKQINSNLNKFNGKYNLSSSQIIAKEILSNHEK